MSKLRIAVIFGGVSSEHSVSRLSATNILKNLNRDKYELVPIGITEKGRWLYYPGDVDLIATGAWKDHADCVSAVISPDRFHKGIIKIMNDGQTSLLPIDCIIPVLHGKNGEDGTMQGLFDLSGIPYVGCGTLASAACMDKAVTHTILEAAGIPMARWKALTRDQLAQTDAFCRECETALGYPMFVKPANAGSSIGVSKAEDLGALKAAIKLAFAHDSKVLVEACITGREVECAVLGNASPQAATPGEIDSCNDFYDFDAKYVLGDSKLFIPARVSQEALDLVRELAVKAYTAIGCTGLSRVDFFVLPDGSVCLNEINTLPGFTDISMYPKMWMAQGMSCSELLDALIGLAIERAECHG